MIPFPYLPDWNSEITLRMMYSTVVLDLGRHKEQRRPLFKSPKWQIDFSLWEEKEKSGAISPDKLYIDVGANDKHDALNFVRPGDRAVFYSGFTGLLENKIMGRAFDDRAGCALLISMIQKKPEYDCVFVFTTQEETGCSGAMAAGYFVNPDVSVVVEATTASDIAGVDAGMTVCKLGEGAAVSFMDKGAVYDAELYRLALKVAEENKIPCQTKSGVFGGNDARSLQTARDGTRILALSLPCRYLHTGNCVLDKSDVKNTEKLLDKLLLELCGNL